MKQLTLKNKAINGMILGLNEHYELQEYDIKYDPVENDPCKYHVTSFLDDQKNCIWSFLNESFWSC